MNSSDENLLRVQENALLPVKYSAQREFTTALSGVIDGLIEDRKRRIDVESQCKKEIASLKHQLSMYTNANSPSGMDPQGYEETKKYLAEAEAYEDTKKTDNEVEVSKEVEGDDKATKDVKNPSKEVEAKPCGGQPGHVGKSHHIKSQYTTEFIAKICDKCGSTCLELLKPINKLETDCGKPGECGEDTKVGYTARVTFGWCDTCTHVIDPAPHLIWGTWRTKKALATTIHYKSNPLGRLPIADNGGYAQTQF